ncbi:MAG: hypothetical protein ACKOXB_10660 [Flavobacteriales bacterium]
MKPFAFAFLLFAFACTTKHGLSIKWNDKKETEDGGCSHKVYYSLNRNGESIIESMGLPYHRDQSDNIDLIKIKDIVLDSLNVTYSINSGKYIVAENEKGNRLYKDSLLFVETYDYLVNKKNISIEKYRFLKGLNKRIVFYSKEFGVLTDWKNDGLEYSLIEYCSNPESSLFIQKGVAFCHEVAMDSGYIYKGPLPDSLAKPMPKE